MDVNIDLNILQIKYIKVKKSKKKLKTNLKNKRIKKSNIIVHVCTYSGMRSAPEVCTRRRTAPHTTTISVSISLSVSVSASFSFPTNILFNK